MFCTNCGKKIPDGSKFCPACGTLLQIEEVTAVDTQTPIIESPKPELKSEREISEKNQTATILHPNDEASKADATSYQRSAEAAPSPSDTIEDVIGKNAAYYLSEFKKVEDGRKTKFNIAAFFLGLFFCFYRKCGDLFKKYFLIPVVAIILALIVTTIALNSFLLPMIVAGGILSAIGSIWAFVNYIRFGKNFNKEYYAHCKAVLATGNKKKYGTSIGAAMIVLAAIVVLSLIPSVVSLLSVFGGSTDSEDFSGLDDIHSSSDVFLDGEYAMFEGTSSSEYIYLNFNWDGPNTLQISSNEDLSETVEATYKIIPADDIVDGIDSYALVINNDHIGEETEFFKFYPLTDEIYHLIPSESWAGEDEGPLTMVPFTEEFGFASDEDEKDASDGNSGSDGYLGYNNVVDISGDWQDSWSERCGMTITAEGDNYYSVDVMWPSSASEYEEWIFSGHYDPDAGQLSYEDGMWISCSESDIDGGSYIVLDNMEGILTFENDVMYWTDFTSIEYDMDFGSTNMCFKKA